MAIRISDLFLFVGQKESRLYEKAAKRLSIPKGLIHGLKICRKSLDARGQGKPRWHYAVDIIIAQNEDRILEEFEEDLNVGKAPPTPPLKLTNITADLDARPVVVGMGPAGLFASLILANAGAPPLIIDRGKPVHDRDADVAALFEHGKLNSDSNVCYGEGGAGAYSDGKLTVRSKDPLVSYVMDTLIALGAPSEIAYLAHPHLGSDKLKKILISFRKMLLEKGVEFYFSTKMKSVLTEGGRCEGLKLENEKEILSRSVILAQGSGDDDLYFSLSSSGARIEQKGFAVGVRIEHAQEMINRGRYGKYSDDKNLPPADYRLTTKLSLPGRRAYTFCMCPGGSVIPATSFTNRLCVNGMSLSDRAGHYANSAIVIAVDPEDLPRHWSSGLEFRAKLESDAYLAGGGDMVAPVQTVRDFLNRKDPSALPYCTYRPGVREANLWDVLPKDIATGIAEAIRNFGKMLSGFNDASAVLVGVEARTSSPVRIVRSELNRQALNISGLYPCGEGAGYAGGIVSSAIDGIRSALSLLKWNE